MATKVIGIAAMDENRVIGNKNTIPWKLPEDMKRFSELTSGHTVLMGRTTYESLPAKFRPLPNRRNVVVTRNPEKLLGEKGIELAADPAAFIQAFKEAGGANSQILWVIGGAEIYKATMSFWDELYLTLVHSKHTGDAFFPPFESSFTLAAEERKDTHSFLKYVRVTRP